MSGPPNLKDRHKHPRHETLCTGTVFVGEQAMECDVLNISTGGAKIRLPEMVETDSTLRIRIDRVGEFTGRVAWRNGSTCGVEFHDELAEVARIVEDILSDSEGISRDVREQPRTSVLWVGELRSAGRTVDCRILNISLRGAQLMADEPIDCGLGVILSIERFGEFAAKLIYQDGEILGVQFQDTPEDILRILGDALPALHHYDRVVPHT